MPLIDPSDPRPVHFMGIAGAGMSALAELCTRRGATVTGCDQNPSGAPDLAATRHQSQRRAQPRAHRGSSRARRELRDSQGPSGNRARKSSSAIPVIRRAEALAEATAGGTLVGIAGTHGKSTTTVMTTQALAAAGINPTGVVGARVGGWNGNLSDGGGDLSLTRLRYSSSKRTNTTGVFSRSSPDVAVVTNVEADHLDIYRDLDDVRAAFTQFVSGARWIVLCADQANSNSLYTPAWAEIVRYGIASIEARLVARKIDTNDGRTSFDVHFDGKRSGRVTIGAVGEHNVLNALAALAVGLSRFGVTVEQMAPGLAAFVGAERRFQRLGTSPE